MKLHEFYQEEKDSTFTHNGVEYDLNKVLRLTKDTPIIDVDVQDLMWILDHDTPDVQRVQRADISKPILVVNQDGEKVVVDGLHRLAKAKRKQVKQLPVKIVTSKILRQSKIHG